MHTLKMFSVNTPNKRHQNAASRLDSQQVARHLGDSYQC